MLFGTDGVRGIVDVDINANLAYNIGKGMAICLRKKKMLGKVVIGCDTRLSSDTYVTAVACGLSDYGIDVVIVGVVSTPIISFLVSRFDYVGGVMITASHNDNEYNGIKVFNDVGEKIDKKSEFDIEKSISLSYKKPLTKGKITYNERIIEKYVEYLTQSFNINLNNMTIVVDAANGSNYKFAPYIYKSLGANVIQIACNNDGENINHECGANHIDSLISEVKLHKADLGIAFDGDGDRLRIVMSNGEVLSGDDILLLFALYLKKQHKLNNLTVVGTIMTNLGAELSLNNYGIKMLRSDVGDKNVVTLMKDRSLTLGGESSGHICLLSFIPNCDALYNSLFFLRCYNDKDVNIDEILKSRIVMPSVLKNIKVDNEFRKNFDKNTSLHREISKLQKQNTNIRIVVRPSGTEAVIRIYVEGSSQNKLYEIVDKVESLLKK